MRQLSLCTADSSSTVPVLFSPGSQHARLLLYVTPQLYLMHVIPGGTHCITGAKPTPPLGYSVVEAINIRRAVRFMHPSYLVVIIVHVACGLTNSTSPAA